MFTPFAFVKSATSPAPAPSYITASAVALYDPILSYPGSGSTLYDLSPQGNNLTFNTKPGFVSQSVPVYSSNDGGRMQLTGSSYWYKCTTSGITAASNDTSYTITTWFQPIISQSIMPGNPGGFIFLIGESSNGQGCYWGTFSGNDGNMRVGVDLGGGSNTQTVLGQASAGNWYNLTYTLSGSKGKAYLNGSLIATSSRGTVGFSSGANPITLGGIDGGDPCPDLNGALNGYIGFSAAYSVPLTDAQVEQNFNAVKARYGL